MGQVGHFLMCDMDHGSVRVDSSTTIRLNATDILVHLIPAT